jgi:PleD family two-component response regulator
MVMERVKFLMQEGAYDDKIIGSKYDHVSLSESIGSQKKTVNIIREEKIFSKVILIVDDEPDVTTVFNLGLQDEGFEVYTCNDPLEALSQFRTNFYDLLLIDINMPNINANVKVCFITAGEVNMEALRELYPTRSIGCYIKKPVTIDQLVRRVKAELE